MTAVRGRYLGMSPWMVLLLIAGCGPDDEICKLYGFTGICQLSCDPNTGDCSATVSDNAVRLTLESSDRDAATFPVSLVVGAGNPGSAILNFRGRVSNRTRVVAASSGPKFVLQDLRTNLTGWQLSFGASTPFTDGTHTLNATAPVAYTNTKKGSVSSVSSKDLHEVASSLGKTLLNPPGLDGSGVFVLTADSGKGGGTTVYTPAASNFRFSIPANTPAGTYFGALTATLIAR